MPALRRAVATTGPAMPPPITRAVRVVDIGISRIRAMGFGSPNRPARHPPGYPVVASLVAGCAFAGTVRDCFDRARRWCCRTSPGPVSASSRPSPLLQVGDFGRAHATVVPRPPLRQPGKGALGQLVAQGTRPCRFGFQHRHTELGLDGEQPGQRRRGEFIEFAAHRLGGPFQRVEAFAEQLDHFVGGSTARMDSPATKRCCSGSGVDSSSLVQSAISARPASVI